MAPSQRQAGNRGDDTVTKKQAYVEKANEVTNETLQSTRRMVALVEESKAVGIDTIDNLVRQGEQLDRIDEGLDEIAVNVKKSERNITEMNKCCGLFTLPWKRWKKFESGDAYKDAFDDKRVAKREKAAAKEAEKSAAAFQNGKPTAAASGRYVDRIMDDDREDEMEENMKATSDAINMLKDMAIDMGTTIDKQNVQIEGIMRKGEANEIGMARNQHRMDRMLKEM